MPALTAAAKPRRWSKARNSIDGRSGRWGCAAGDDHHRSLRSRIEGSHGVETASQVAAAEGRNHDPRHRPGARVVGRGHGLMVVIRLKYSHRRAFCTRRAYNDVVRLAIDARKLTDFGIGTYLCSLLSGLEERRDVELSVVARPATRTGARTRAFGTGPHRHREGVLRWPNTCSCRRPSGERAWMWCTSHTMWFRLSPRGPS